MSQSIKKLEDEVGAPLFARGVHEVALTDAGRVLADYARRMVGLRDEANVSASARELIKIVRAFDWGRVQPRIARGRAQAAGVSQLRVVR